MGDDNDVDMDAAPASPTPAPVPAAGDDAGGWGTLAMNAGSWAADVEDEHEASGRNDSVIKIEREKAKKRAERFNTEYKTPNKKAMANGLLSRKEILAMRREEQEKRGGRGGGGGFVTGIDLFDPEEERKRAARANKFGAMLVALTPEQAALKAKEEAERAETQEKLRQRREKYGIEEGAGDQAGMDGVQHGDMLEERVDPELDAVWRSDAVHLYGVDHMTTGECMGYFGEYGPVFCEWINDSSCNVVFADEHTARRAIRMKGDAMGAGANPDEKGALPEGTDAGMLWHSGPDFHKAGKTLQLSFRLATDDDVKPHGKIRSRHLWWGLYKLNPFDP